MYCTLSPIAAEAIELNAIPKDFDRARILFEKTFPLFGRDLDSSDIIALYAEPNESVEYMSQERKIELIDYHVKLKNKWQNNFQLWFESVDIPFARKKHRPYFSGTQKTFFYYEDVSRVVEAVLSAKYGMPYSLKFDNLVAVHNYVLQYAPAYYYQFIGVAKYYGHYDKLYPADPIRAKEWKNKVAKSKDKINSTNHTLNKLITFLCPVLENRLFDWESKLGVSKPFDSSIFYENLLSDESFIDEAFIPNHTAEILTYLRDYANNCLETSSYIRTNILAVLLQFIQQHYTHSKTYVTFYSRHSIAWEQQECDEFAVLLDFLNLSFYIDDGMYDSNANMFFLSLNDKFKKLDEISKYEIERKISSLMNMVLTQYENFHGNVGHGRSGLPSLLWEELDEPD